MRCWRDLLPALVTCCRAVSREDDDVSGNARAGPGRDLQFGQQIETFFGSGDLTNDVYVTFVEMTRCLFTRTGGSCTMCSTCVIG
jgi:hypothetical protein